MGTVTAAPATELIPSSRTEQDPTRVARGEPRRHLDGVPVYGWGQAPAYLRTQTQLAGARLKLADGQLPLAYISTRTYGDVALYDPAGADKMKPLPSSARKRMEARRTCPQCRKVRREIVRDKQCSVCWGKERAARERKEARTCWGCRAERERPYPKGHHRCAACRSKQLAEQREQAAQWLARVTTCAGDGCTVKLVTKKEALAWRRTATWAGRPTHWPLRCAPCQAGYEQLLVERQERYEREQRERQEAEQRAADERREWAAAALVDPDVVVLDTETTGLHSAARIVEVAVLNGRGDVLLDSLVNPGEPIPAKASEIHGITDEMVASAPTFSALLVQLTSVLDGKRVLIYNDTYDIGMLRHELTLHYLDRAAATAAAAATSTGTVPADLRERALEQAREQAAVWLDAMAFEDVMVRYSDWVGDWSEYHGNNRWQPLGGGHRAAGDCRAVLGCLRAMGAPDRDDQDVWEPPAAGAGGWSKRMAG